MFRPEAIAHQRHKFLGQVVLRQPWSALALSAVFGVLFGVLLLGFFLLGFARFETLQGRLQPTGGLMPLSSSHAGTVQQVCVVQGQSVREGDVLFVMSGLPASVPGSDPSWRVRALRDGRVTMLAVQPGQLIAAGELLGSMALAGVAMEAVLYAPPRVVDQLKIGMPVHINVLPRPVQGAFAGEVHDISRAPVPPAEVLTSLSGDLPMYRVHVRLLPADAMRVSQLALRAGMPLEATLTLEYRRLYQWALGPLLDPPRQTN